MSNSTPYVQYIPGCEQLLFSFFFYFFFFNLLSFYFKLHSPRRVATVLLTGCCWDVTCFKRNEKGRRYTWMSHSLQDSLILRGGKKHPKKFKKSACKRTCVEGMAKYWDFPELVGFRARLASLSRHCTLCFGWLVSVMVWVFAVATPRNEEVQRIVDVNSSTVDKIKRLMLSIQSTVPIKEWLFVTSQAGFTSTQT